MKVFYRIGLILCLMVLAIGLGAQTEDIDFKEITVTTGFERYELNDYLGDHKVSTPLEGGGFAIMWQQGYTNLYLNFINRDGEKFLKEPYHIELEEGYKWARCFLESDHEGGVYLIYSYENYQENKRHLYINRISPEGSASWGEKGVRIKTPDNSAQIFIGGGCFGTALADKEGITVFIHEGTSQSYPMKKIIYAQRFDGEGEAQLSEFGNVVYEGPGTKCGMIAVDDGEGGAFLIWDEDLNGMAGTYGEIHMRAQRIDEKFEPQWNSTEGVLIKKCKKQGSVNGYHLMQNRKAFRVEDKLYVVFEDYDTNYGDFVKNSEQTELHTYKLNGKRYKKPLIFREECFSDMVPDGKEGFYLLNYKRFYIPDPFYRSAMRVHHIDNKLKKTWGEDGIRFQPERYIVRRSPCCQYTEKKGLRLFWTNYTEDQDDFKNVVCRVTEDGELLDGINGKIIMEASIWMDIRSRMHDSETGDLLTLLYQHNESDGFFNYLNISALLFKGDIAEEEEDTEQE